MVTRPNWMAPFHMERATDEPHAGSLLAASGCRLYHPPPSRPLRAARSNTFRLSNITTRSRDVERYLEIRSVALSDPEAAARSRSAATSSIGLIRRSVRFPPRDNQRSGANHASAPAATPVTGVRMLK